MGTFVTRDSNIYWEYTYNRFVYPLNVEHCAMHCIFDTESKCDFFFIVHSYCHLGNFNQPSGAYHYTDTVTTYINKGMVLLTFLSQNVTGFIALEFIIQMYQIVHTYNF